jgi:hypothetical protein
MREAKVTDFSVSRSGVSYVRFRHAGRTFDLAWAPDDKRLVHTLLPPPEASVLSITRLGEPPVGGGAGEGIVLANGVPVLVEYTGP